MKKLAGLLLASCIAAPAFAADMPMAPAPVEAYVPAAVYDWSGFYIGAHVGHGWGEVGLSGGIEYDSDGFFGGGQIGYNFQSGNFVFGLEVDGSISNADGSVDLVGLPLTIESQANWHATVRGRLGYAFDNVLPYVTGGFAVLEAESDVIGGGTTIATLEETYTGWTVGGGVEVGVSENFSVKVEYSYTDYGSETSTFTIPGGPTVDSDSEITAHSVKGGVNFRF